MNARGARGRLAVLVLAALAPTAAWAGGSSADPDLIPDFGTAPAQAPAAPAPSGPAAAPRAPLYNPFRAHDENVDVPRDPHGRAYVALTSRFWIADGSVNTRYNVQVPPNEVSPAGLDVFLGETRDYNVHGLMIVEGAELAPLRWLSFEAEYGSDKPAGGYGDHFWVDAPEATLLTNLSNGATWHNPNHEDDVVYSSDQSANREWVAASAFIRIIDSSFLEVLNMRDTVDLAVGAERFRQNANMSNASIVFNENKFYAPGLPLGPIPGYASYYDATWQGPHFGFREEFQAKNDFSLTGILLWSPFMEYSGTGYDNLSVNPTGLRQADPNYADWAHGTAIHFFLTAGWSPVRWLRLEAGWQRLYFYSRTGLRRYYNFDGSTNDVQLDYAQASLAGFFGGATLRF
jgi:hypothetical protein